MPIYFYGSKEQYGCFSNFSRHGISLDGKYWPTTEHYFQAQKFPGTAHEGRIRQASGPGEAKRFGHDRSQTLRPDWESVKDDIMRRAVLCKFETHADIRAILLGTGDEELIENAPSDFYWGCGSDGSGRNMLGRVLMEVRAALRQPEKTDE